MKSPEPKSLPTLMGSWQRVDTFTYSDGTSGVDTVTLTFTKSRFIWHERTEWDDGAVTFHSNSGVWDSTDTTITKTARGWERTEDDTFRQTDELASVKKEYVWGDAERNSLIVHIWRNLSRPASRFERYTRLDPLSGGINGVWHYDGGEFTRTLTVSDTSVEDSATFDGTTSSITGDLKRHDLDEGFLFITVTSAEGWPNVEAGHELKYAYAQTGPNTIVVSPHNDERVFDEDEMMWGDRTGTEAYGNYWLVLEKQQ